MQKYSPMCLYFLSMFEDAQRGQASSALKRKTSNGIIDDETQVEHNNRLWSRNPEIAPAKPGFRAGGSWGAQPRSRVYVFS
jgi:hypothetical protein